MAKDLKRLAEWYEQSGRSYGPALGEYLEDNSDDSENESVNAVNESELSTSSGVEVPEQFAASQEQQAQDKIFRVLRKVFKALAAAPDRRLSRSWIQQRTLDRQLSGAELTELQSHALVQKYVSIEKVKGKGPGPLCAEWTLKETALECPADLGFVFGPKPEPKVETPKPEVESEPFDYGNFEQIRLLVAMPWGEFKRLPLEERRSLPLRNSYFESMETGSCKENFAREMAAWPQRPFVAEDGTITSRRQRPQNYWFDPNEIVLPEVCNWDGTPIPKTEKPTPLCYSPRDPGMARPQRKYVPGSELGEVPADWERRGGFNGW